MDNRSINDEYHADQIVLPSPQVKNREKYHFQPRTLLSEIMDIYLNLNSATFIKAVSKDTRSYKKEYFSKAASILLRHGLKHQDDITDLERFVNKVEVAVQEEQEEEEELGNVPDEFLGKFDFSEALHTGKDMI